MISKDLKESMLELGRRVNQGDAERYRWLREAFVDGSIFIMDGLDTLNDRISFEYELDLYIDKELEL